MRLRVGSLSSSSVTGCGRETTLSLYCFCISIALENILSKSLPFSASISCRTFRTSSTIGSSHILHLHQLLRRADHRCCNSKSIIHFAKNSAHSTTGYVRTVPTEQVGHPVPDSHRQMRGIYFGLLWNVDSGKIRGGQLTYLVIQFQDG